MLVLELPFPPSVNTYWRHPTKGKLAGRHLISEKGRAYRDEVKLKINLLKLKTIIEPVAIDIQVFMPDNRRRDLDNLLKSLLDSLTFSGVWEDDNQAHDIRIYKSAQKGGYVLVKIKKLD